MLAKALVSREFAAPAELTTIEVPEPGPGEVRLKIAASGVCGSDAHVLHGPSTAVRLPTVLGHEGAGVVEAVGPDVVGVRPGDHVVVGLGIWCGTCFYCVAGRPSLCESPARVASMFGLRPNGRTRVTEAGADIHTFLGVGTLAEYALAPARQVVVVDSGLPLDELCLLGCGVMTGVGAALNTARVAPGEAVAVIGCGGVGLSVIQGARIGGATTIIAIDRVPAKLELAKQLGATHTIDASTADVREAVLAIAARGVDHAFEVVGRPELVTLALTLVRPGSTAYMVGILPPRSTITTTRESLMGERRLMSSAGGSAVAARGIPILIELYRTGQLKLGAMISQRLPLERVAEAFAAMDTGSAARTVITFES
jgi:S-(hydroxymethyl)glutathione dehydrogenase/alcohol dehydrogenase